MCFELQKKWNVLSQAAALSWESFMSSTWYQHVLVYYGDQIKNWSIQKKKNCFISSKVIPNILYSFQFSLPIFIISLVVSSLCSDFLFTWLSVILRWRQLVQEEVGARIVRKEESTSFVSADSRLFLKSLISMNWARTVWQIIKWKRYEQEICGFAPWHCLKVPGLSALFLSLSCMHCGCPSELVFQPLHN